MSDEQRDEQAQSMVIAERAAGATEGDSPERRRAGLLGYVSMLFPFILWLCGIALVLGILGGLGYYFYVVVQLQLDVGLPLWQSILQAPLGMILIPIMKLLPTNLNEVIFLFSIEHPTVSSVVSIVMSLAIWGKILFR